MQKNYEPGDTSSGACYSLKVCPHKCSFWVWLGMKMIPWKMSWNTKNVRLFVSPLVQHFWAIFQGIPSIHRLIASPILPNRYGTKMNKKQNHPNAVVCQLWYICLIFPWTAKIRPFFGRMSLVPGPRVTGCIARVLQRRRGLSQEFHPVFQLCFFSTKTDG